VRLVELPNLSLPINSFWCKHVLVTNCPREMLARTTVVVQTSVWDPREMIIHE
jgi:hypothetical protein